MLKVSENGIHEFSNHGLCADNTTEYLERLPPRLVDAMIVILLDCIFFLGINEFGAKPLSTWHIKHNAGRDLFLFFVCSSDWRSVRMSVCLVARNLKLGNLILCAYILVNIQMSPVCLFGQALSGNIDLADLVTLTVRSWWRKPRGTGWGHGVWYIFTMKFNVF